MTDEQTLRDIGIAREKFDVKINEPDPNAPRPNQRKVGIVTAIDKVTGVHAGSLTYGVSEDAQDNLIVRTTQFDTEDDFKGQHVALLLAYSLWEHYPVEVLQSTDMEPTQGGSGVIASLRRRGIMAAAT